MALAVIASGEALRRCDPAARGRGRALADAPAADEPGVRLRAGRRLEEGARVLPEVLQPASRGSRPPPAPRPGSWPRVPDRACSTARRRCCYAKPARATSADDAARGPGRRAARAGDFESGRARPGSRSACAQNADQKRLMEERLQLYRAGKAYRARDERGAASDRAAHRHRTPRSRPRGGPGARGGAALCADGAARVRVLRRRLVPDGEPRVAAADSRRRTCAGPSPSSTRRTGTR